MSSEDDRDIMWLVSLIQQRDKTIAKLQEKVAEYKMMNTSPLLTDHKTKWRFPNRGVAKRRVRFRFADNGSIDTKVAELRAMNAPEDVIAFVQNIPSLGIQRVKSAAGQMLDKYGVKWRTETFTRLLSGDDR